ncbi:transcriptional regulator with XRE-family HTH domain [Streptomyces sp. PvR006]|uniref:XRE family transcriptional regulator n=1 Tax=Streptomyces sp. PvR006 TaxID=2817860 RepID=UPI001AE10888|nr:XRE family transcriptional regulator [Streptomyces sp. PvR006]MBP2586933.1 transcriptional regulator with XRE-family HTH domain [Streptomyces sp. PvR006]
MAADRPDDREPALVLGRALRDLQRRSGRTLRALEESVRISDSSLSRYFCGSTVPPWSTVHDLCRALDGDPAEFRHLWEAADRSQRRPVQTDRSGQRDAAPAPLVADGDPAGDAPAEHAPRTRPSFRGGRAAWALAGTVLGLVLGAGSAVLVRPQAPATASGDDAPPVASHGTSDAREHDRIFVSRATGACLDDSLDKGTRSFPCNGMSYQRWTVRTTADGGTQLRNHATGECLDHGADGLRTGPCGPAASQRWSVSAGSDSSFEVRSASTRRCLDDSPEGLRVLTCDRTVRQKWA